MTAALSSNKLKSKTERKLELPFPTLGVGVVGQEHGQVVHEVLPSGSLLPSGGHGPAVQTGRIHH